MNASSGARVLAVDDDASMLELVRHILERAGYQVEVAPDGAVWMIEDANPGGLFRVTPK